MMEDWCCYRLRAGFSEITERWRCSSDLQKQTSQTHASQAAQFNLYATRTNRSFPDAGLQPIPLITVTC